MICVCDPTGFLKPISDETLKARVAQLEQTGRGLPAALQEGEQTAQFYNQTQRSRELADA